jgi:hypothetical protein
VHIEWLYLDMVLSLKLWVAYLCKGFLAVVVVLSQIFNAVVELTMNKLSLCYGLSVFCFQWMYSVLFDLFRACC